jgi:YggT family protein
MYSLLKLVYDVIYLYSLAVFIWFVLGLLLHFRIVNRSHVVVYKVDDFLNRIINPVLKPIRKYIPAVGGLDLSPLVLIFGLQFLQHLILEYGFGYRGF